MADYRIEINGNSEGNIQYAVCMEGDFGQDAKLTAQKVVDATRLLVGQLILTKQVTPQTQTSSSPT